jgi:hypothetical protein
MVAGKKNCLQIMYVLLQAGADRNLQTQVGRI